MMTRVLPPLMLNSLPKAGTHLLSRLFEYLPLYTHSGVVLSNETAKGHEDDRSDIKLGVTSPKRINPSAFTEVMRELNYSQYHYGHLPYSKETDEILTQLGVKMVVLLRDPRAVVCSNVHFILKNKHHELHDTFTALPNFNAQLKTAIVGFDRTQNARKELLSINQCYASIAKWGTDANKKLIFFEDLIGARGDGDELSQRKTVSEILSYVGYPYTNDDLTKLCDQIFSESSPTFSRGRVEGWRMDFTPELEQYFNDNAGDSFKMHQQLRQKHTAD